VDIPYSAAGKVPRPGGLVPEVFLAAFADGAVRAIVRQIPEAPLRRLITRADGMPNDADAFIDPVLTADPEQLRRENRDIEAEIAAARNELVELRRLWWQKRSRGSPDLSPLQLLRAEQKRLLMERDDVRREVENLRGQLGRPDPRPAVGGNN